MSETPATLPANFFADKTPPSTLPANFDFKKGAAPAVDTSADSGAAQATGLRAQPKGAAAMNEFLDAPEGKAMREANVGAAKFGAEALAGQKLYQAIGAAFKPVMTKVPVPTGIFDAGGKEIMREVQQVSKSATEKALRSFIPKLVRKAMSGYGVYEVAKHLGVPLP
jgi:hypothetical protein